MFSFLKPKVRVVVRVRRGEHGWWRWTVRAAQSNIFLCGGPPHGFPTAKLAEADARRVLTRLRVERWDVVGEDS